MESCWEDVGGLRKRTRYLEWEKDGEHQIANIGKQVPTTKATRNWAKWSQGGRGSVQDEG